MNTQRNKRRGGTLAITLGIAAIIIVIALVILPMFVPQREIDRKSPCQSNMKELSTALLTYMNDYDGCLPSSMLVRHSKKWNSTDFDTFATRMGTLPPAGDRRPRTYCEVLYSHMKSEDIMFCPNDEVDKSNPKARVSYWWKAAVDKAWYGDGCKPCRNEKDFAYNSDQIIFYERSAWHSNDSSGKLENGATINVAYLDSHIKTVQLTSSTHVGCSDPTAPGEPRYFNKYIGGKKPGEPVKGPARYVDPRLYCDDL